MTKKATRKGKHPGGRPRKIDEKIIKKLVEGFKNDFTIEEACRYAKISVPTYYDESKRNPKFSEEMTAAQDFPMILAKKRIFKSINQPGSGDLALKMLERRQRDRYSPKIIQEHTGDMTVKYHELESPKPTAATAEEAKRLAEQ